MRRLFTLAILLFFSGRALAQFGHEQLASDLRYFSDTHKDYLNISANYFIDSPFYKNFGLTKKPSGSKRLLALEGSTTKGNDILMVLECIWKFDNKQQLDSFITRFRPAFTLNGIKVTDPSAVPGVALIGIYKDGKDFKRWNDSLKQPSAGFYTFIFSVGNIVVNIYVQTRKDVPLENAAIFAREAADRLKKATGIK